MPVSGIPREAVVTLATMRDSVWRRLCVVALLARPLAAAAQGAPVPSEPPDPSAERDAPEAAARPDEPKVAMDRATADSIVASVRQELLALVDEDARRVDRDALAEPAAAAPLRQQGPAASLTSRVPQAQVAQAPSPKDLSWLEGLTLPDLPVRWDDRLVRLLEYYKDDSRGRAHMRALQARRTRYGDMITTKLRAAKLPEDLLYVAMVESGYEPTARSPVGALGLWQFMSSPAGDYSMEISRWVDQRMDPERATDGAAQYFTQLYDDVGSWPLAMAAYNMGYGALLRAVQKYNTNDFWLLSHLEAGLPYETIVYVTKITACAIVGRNLARFGLADLAFDAKVDTAPVQVAGGVGIARVARAIGMEAEALAALNPELKKSRVPPDVKLWTLRIPRDRAARFKDKWARYQAELPSHRTHLLRLGERVADVAAMYGTTATKLLSLNDLDSARDLRAGHKLLVPDVEPEKVAAPEQPTVGLPGDQFVYVDRKRVFYRVADGDTLDEIGRFFGVNSDELRMWNQVSSDAQLQRSMYLQLFVPTEQDLSQALVLTPDEVRTLVVGSEEFFDFHETQQNRVRLRYRVKAGDTLRSLSERFDLSVGSIARINQFGRDKKLDPDSEIIVYVPEDTAKRVAAN